MKLYKRVPKNSPQFKTAPWWADFTIEGTRYRVSLDTDNKPEARKLAKKKETAASAGNLSAKSHSFARLTFSEACDRYLASRKLELQASSLAKEKQLTVKLKEYFGSVRLNRVSSEQVITYREQRGTGNALINMEIGVFYK